MFALIRLQNILLLLCCTWAKIAWAQVASLAGDDIKFINLSINQGLTQSSVLCMLQDQQGYMWMGTRDGLNRYDGRNFTRYRHSPQDSFTISHNIIKALLQDERGNFWVGTANGLNLFHAATGRFNRIELGALTAAQKSISCLAADGKNNLWMGTDDGLLKYHIPTKKLTSYKNLPGYNNKMAANTIQALLMDEQENLWICTGAGAYRLNIAAQTFTPYPIQGHKPNDDGVRYVSSFYRDGNGTLWLGYSGGLTVLNNATKQFEPYYEKGMQQNSITSPVRAIREDGNGNLWIGAYDGLYILHLGNGSLLHHQHSNNNSNSLSQNSVYSICRDRAGDMWVGTYFGGINYYNRNYDRFKYIGAGTGGYKLNYKVVSAVVQDKSGNLWIGTEGGGLNFYNKKTGLFNYYLHNPDDPRSISVNNIKAIIMDKKGGLWIGTHDGGLNYMNPAASFQFKNYKNHPSHPGSISNNRVISLFEDQSGFIWAGTSGGGLNRLNPATGRFERIPIHKKNIGSDVFTIVQSHHPKKIWVGSSAGLAEVNIESLQVRSINYGSGKTSSPVLSVYASGKELWVGTEGDGLYAYNRQTGKALHYGIGGQLLNDIVYRILPDDNNNLWLSTNSGLCQLQRHTGRIKSFDESDGLQSNEFNYGAAMRDADGNLYFGGVNGLNYFAPASITINTHIPPVYITSVKINNNRTIPLHADGEIELKYDENLIHFSFVALNYVQPQKNQYASRLEGFDKGWNHTGNTNTATYTNLDAGNYTFRVKASNNDGVWNEQGAFVKIKILPAPWKTWWAYSFYALLAGGLFWFVRKQTLQRLKDRNALAAERREKERTEYLNQLFTHISHDLRTPLTLIISPLQRLMKLQSGDADMQHQHRVMYKNARALMQLINQILDFTKSEAKGVSLAATPKNIVPFITDIKSSFDEYARERNIQYTITSTAAVVVVNMDEVQFQKVIYNLLSNAFKFTPAGGCITIHICVQTEPSSLAIIAVKDTGAGIPAQNINNIFDPYYQVHKGLGTGIGLALVKNIVTRHNGTVQVTSAVNEGSCFTISLPLISSGLMQEQTNAPLNGAGEAPLLPVLPQANTTAVELPVTYHKNRESILVVEDNEDLRQFITGIFKNEYNVYTAQNGREALATAAQHRTDIIISDVMMPEMDGMELCKQIKSQFSTSHIPVLLLTAKTAEASEKSGYMLGADAYITKPFDSEVLAMRVSNILASRRKLVERYRQSFILEPVHQPVESASPDEQFLKDLMVIVEENLMEPDFTIDVLVRKIGVSRSVLYRKLKALTGQSISELVRTVKLKKAAHLLETTNLSISEIAFSLNFNDQKHFRQSFKELFGVIPSAYRLQNKE